MGPAALQTTSRREQKHADAIATLLDRYDLDDPADGNALGEFTNPKLQALYDQLIVQGSKSAADALKVGAAIEEIDILDLQERLDETEDADIRGSTRTCWLAPRITCGLSFAPEDPDQRDLCSAVSEPEGLRCHRQCDQWPRWWQRWSGRPRWRSLAVITEVL